MAAAYGGGERDQGGCAGMVGRPRASKVAGLRPAWPPLSTGDGMQFLLAALWTRPGQRCLQGDLAAVPRGTTGSFVWLKIPAPSVCPQPSWLACSTRTGHQAHLVPGSWALCWWCSCTAPAAALPPFTRRSHPRPSCAPHLAHLCAWQSSLPPTWISSRMDLPQHLK